MKPSKRARMPAALALERADQMQGLAMEEQFPVQGITGTTTMNRAAYDQYKAALDDRQSKGRYTLEEAAMLIERETGERADEMLKKFMGAALNGALHTHEPGKQSRYLYGDGFASRVRDFYEEAYFYDLNIWLVANEPRIAWRFPDPQLPPGKRAIDSRPKWEIPERLEYEARTVNAGTKGASVAE